MNNTTAKEDLVELFSTIVLPHLIEIKEKLANQVIPDRKSLDDTIAALNEFQDYRKQISETELIEEHKPHIVFDDVVKHASRDELKELLKTTRGYASILSDIGRKLLTRSEFLTEYPEKEVLYLCERGYIGKIVISSRPDDVRWTVTTKGIDVLTGKEVLPEHRISRKSMLLPTEWTEAVFERIDSICDFLGHNTPFLISFIDINKKIPLGCKIEKADASEQRAIISLVNGTDTYDREQVNTILESSEGTPLFCLLSNSESADFLSDLRKYDNVRFRFIEQSEDMQK